MRSVLFTIFLVLLSSSVFAQDATAIQDLKAQIEALKQQYEQRIKDLEQKVEQLQVQALQAPEPEAAPAPTQGQTIPGALNPTIAVAANFVGRADDQDVFNADGNPIQDRLNLREAELDLRVPVDPYADGV